MNMHQSDYYIYTPATTDVTIRWKLKGWVAPTQNPEYQKKWANFRKISAAGIESLQNPMQVLKEN